MKQKNIFAVPVILLLSFVLQSSASVKSGQLHHGMVNTATANQRNVAATDGFLYWLDYTEPMTGIRYVVRFPSHLGYVGDVKQYYTWYECSNDSPDTFIPDATNEENPTVELDMQVTDYNTGSPIGYNFRITGNFTLFKVYY